MQFLENIKVLEWSKANFLSSKGQRDAHSTNLKLLQKYLCLGSKATWSSVALWSYSSFYSVKLPGKLWAQMKKPWRYCSPPEFRKKRTLMRIMSPRSYVSVARKRSPAERNDSWAPCSEEEDERVLGTGQRKDSQVKEMQVWSLVRKDHLQVFSI